MSTICSNCFSETVNEQGICSVCGYDTEKNREEFPRALPPGSILCGRYIVGRVLGQGGFGITYLAQDYQNKSLVAIKEFFPDSMATRTGRTNVTPFSGDRSEHFFYGKDAFLKEAKTMAEFIGEEGIVRVFSYFEENNTGYFVMEYVEGMNLQEYVKQYYGRISWDEAVRIMLPVMNALSKVHEKGIIHRDVTPDNIRIREDGTVKLLDFGAARHSLGNVSRSLDVVVKHGFAPKEQYNRHGRQGPYTDVYSVAASIYYAITGTRPDDAIERLDEDNLPLPSTLGAQVTVEQEDVLLKGLAIRAEDRYQTITEFRDALMPKKAAPPVLPILPKPEPPKPEPPKPEPPKPESPSEPEDPSKPGNKKKLIAAICAALLVCVGAAFWMLHPHKYGDWIISEPATCTGEGVQIRKCFCGETESRAVSKLGHNVVVDYAVAATCSDTGLTEGSHCSVCGTVITEQTSTPRLEHTITTLAAVPPTCVNTGLTEGVGCPNCGYAETPQEIVPALGHTAVTDAAVASTCAKEGKTEGSHCSVCGEVLVAQESTPKSDHIPAKDPAVPATCKTNGKTEGSHCSVCGEVLVAQESTPKSDHTPAKDPAVPATCKANGKTEGSHCSVCGTVLVEQKSTPKSDHSPVKDPAVPATCTEAGLTEGSHCSVCGTTIKAQSRSGSPLGHSFSENKCIRCSLKEWYISASPRKGSYRTGETAYVDFTLYSNSSGKRTAFYVIITDSYQDGSTDSDKLTWDSQSSGYVGWVSSERGVPCTISYSFYTSEGYYLGGTTIYFVS